MGGINRDTHCASTSNLTPNKTRQLDAWNLRTAKVYAEIARRVEGDYGEVIATITDLHNAWTVLERSCGTLQYGISLSLIPNSPWQNGAVRFPLMNTTTKQRGD